MQGTWNLYVCRCGWYGKEPSMSCGLVPYTPAGMTLPLDLGYRKRSSFGLGCVNLEIPLRWSRELSGGKLMITED